MKQITNEQLHTRQYLSGGDRFGNFFTTTETFVILNGEENIINTTTTQAIPTCEDCECAFPIEPALLETLQFLWDKCGQSCCECGQKCKDLTVSCDEDLA